MPGFEDMTVSELFVPNTNRWNVPLISEIFNNEDKQVILRTTPSPLGCRDKRI